MKVTNISPHLILLRDLRVMPAAQNEGRRGEERYLQPGMSVYFPNTQEVLRSAMTGDISKFKALNYLTIEDTVTLQANGDPNDTVVLPHGFGFPPAVYVLKQVGVTWVDATGTYDASHDVTFQNVTVVNTTAGILTFLIRLL